jgi:multiple sugar transport system ATP-binding protein
MAQLKVEKVVKAFGNATILQGVDLTVEDGEFCVFVGPSGCGKSTLLRIICGLEEVTEGALYIDGVEVADLPPAKRDVAMVFQSYALYPHMTVAQNMGFGLKLLKTPKAEIDQRVGKAAKILQIEHLLARKPRELSGGQRQRVAIGRAIVRQPKIFLFDEPLSNLDAALRVDMRVELAKLKAELGATVIYVTHDQVEAMTLADKIVVLRDGKVEQVGRPLELYHHPANQFVAGFIGSPRMNFVSATAKGGTAVELPGGSVITLSLAESPLPGATVTLGIRPEALRVGAAENAITGTVEVVEALGGETLLHLATPCGRLTVKSEGDPSVAIGDSVSVGFSSTDGHLFEQSGKAFKRA